MTDINVPQLGESVTEATVGSWLVKTGDVVAKDDATLVEVFQSFNNCSDARVRVSRAI